MKKISFLIVAVLLMVSCSSDDDNSTPESEINASIVGVWDLVDFEYGGTTDTRAQGQSIRSEFIGEAFNIDYSLTFEEDPNVVTANGGYDVRLTTTTFGQTSIQEVSNLNSINTGDWEIVDGNILRSTTDGEVSDLKIETLTETRLVLLIDDQQTISDFGVEVESDITGRLSFER